MVDFGKLAKRAKGLADTHGDKIAKGVDKATDAVDQRTKGKYKDKLAKVDGMARKLDKTGTRGQRDQDQDDSDGSDASGGGATAGS